MFFIVFKQIIEKILRIWSDRMSPQHFEEISNEIERLHKPMKNMIEIVFAVSPLLALSTHGWSSSNYHSTYLLRVSDAFVAFFAFINLNQIFLALGNNRPQILVRLEDHVLQAIIGISEGKSREDAMDTLYTQILPLEKDLTNDDDALNWFNICMAVIPPVPELHKNKFLGQWYMLITEE